MIFDTAQLCVGTPPHFSSCLAFPGCRVEPRGGGLIYPSHLRIRYSSSSGVSSQTVQVCRHTYVFIIMYIYTYVVVVFFIPFHVH